MKILRLANSEGDYIELTEQYQTGDIVLAEAQITISCEPVDGSMTFYIDDVGEMNAYINWLTVIRDKMVLHYNEHETKTDTSRQ